MPFTQPASLLRIHICEGDKFGEKRLYEAIVDKCLDLGLAGASVFRAVEGYGETAEIHRRRLLAKDQPIVIVIVDSEKKINDALPALENLVDTGMVATSRVQVKRLRKALPSG